MATISGAIAAQQATIQQNIGTAVLRNAAQQQQAIVGVITEAVANGEALASEGPRGTNLNITV